VGKVVGHLVPVEQLPSLEELPLEVIVMVETSPLLVVLHLALVLAVMYH
jgi:hypothetical protein